MERHVSAYLDVDIKDATVLEFQITAARCPGLELTETLSWVLDGEPVEAAEIVGPHGTRLHRFRAEPGNLQVNYRATVEGRAAADSPSDHDLSLYLRPSRYAESDKFFGFAAQEFGKLDKSEAVGRIVEWVHSRMYYVPGSSRGTDGASDTLLSGAGVCRDYSHLVVTLLRAVTIPARMAAVYAPGCVPMDFHSVVEAYVDGVWHVVDATRMAPRQSVVRIATGRDSADTAFLDNHGGDITLNNVWVTATVEGDLPVDDGWEPLSIG